MSQKVSNWRNDVEVLRRELESHRDYIAQLKSGKETGSATKDRGLVFREALHRILDKLNSNMKALISLLKKVMSLPRQGEFGQRYIDTWESVLQKLQIDLAQVSINGMREGPEEAISLIFQAYEVRDSLLSQALQALLHKKTVLWMDLGIGSEEFVKTKYSKRPSEQSTPSTHKATYLQRWNTSIHGWTSASRPSESPPALAGYRKLHTAWRRSRKGSKT